MPELPEVETVVRNLCPELTGHTIMAVRRSKKKLRRPWDGSFDASIVGAKVTGLRRRGKWILIDLDTPHAGGPPGDHAVLRVHLGMTGQLTVAEADSPEPPHLHLAFSLDDGRELRFRDPRRFGSAEYFVSAADTDYAQDTVMGPEPFGLDPDEFRAALGLTRQKLKAILLNQRLVAGVGNIYAAEICFEAKLHPERTGNSLTPAESDRLRVAIARVLQRAIRSKGTDLGDGVYLVGKYRPAVYGRTGEPCRACGTAIQLLRLSNRASHYCPKCQPVSPRRKAAVRPKKKS